MWKNGWCSKFMDDVNRFTKKMWNTLLNVHRICYLGIFVLVGRYKPLNAKLTVLACLNNFYWALCYCRHSNRLYHITQEMMSNWSVLKFSLFLLVAKKNTFWSWTTEHFLILVTRWEINTEIFWFLWKRHTVWCTNIWQTFWPLFVKIQ